ncbi:MAG: LytTR family transcriptional regulator [Loigolactobacillus coryniformis]|uniref:LytTR family DNA-binding domain-containing protein n=1 Tax=Loigolactobacillus coryniformis TaxID=1610 RepID=UPI0026496723|nr:LytTR family DNA-binding domain-containing protein [Loigolactobacillus coryniformis]MDN5950784.1 LytTR family transcriptional regulator [Loigolactobacillus coryniformis]MDN5953085.1 LytTR family transcriptional regulator [Loigolactobacillus coryniformis]
MKVTIELDDTAQPPFAVIHTPTITTAINQTIAKIQQDEVAYIIGYAAEKMVPLQPQHIIRFYSETKAIYAQTETSCYLIKERLYQLEKQLPTNFLRISHSEIINIKTIVNLELTFNGLIQINLATNIKTYTSRRYVKQLKERLGL